MEKQKLTKDEYLDSLDPDNLNLEKKDLINFCHGCIEEWKKSKMANFKYIVAMELFISTSNGFDIFFFSFKKETDYTNYIYI